MWATLGLGGCTIAPGSGLSVSRVVPGKSSRATRSIVIVTVHLGTKRNSPATSQPNPRARQLPSLGG